MHNIDVFASMHPLNLLACSLLGLVLIKTDKQPRHFEVILIKSCAPEIVQN